jgi:hypothetical protein
VERQGGEQSGEELSRAGQNIEVLGTPLLTLAGQPSELSGKSLALVCSLELEGETRRAALADLLWTDALEDAGRPTCAASCTGCAPRRWATDWKPRPNGWCESPKGTAQMIRKGRKR